MSKLMSCVYCVRLHLLCPHHVWSTHNANKAPFKRSRSWSESEKRERRDRTGECNTKKKQKNPQKNKWESLRVASPASEGSILISTISRCSLAADPIDSSTWLGQTSGSRKHRGHQRREPLLLLRLRPLSFLSGTGAQCNKSETGEEEAQKKISLTLFLSPGLLCFWGLSPPPSGFFTTLSNSTLYTRIHTHDGHPRDALGADYRVTHEAQVRAISQAWCVSKRRTQIGHCTK